MLTNTDNKLKEFLATLNPTTPSFRAFDKTCKVYISNALWGGACTGFKKLSVKTNDDEYLDVKYITWGLATIEGIKYNVYGYMAKDEYVIVADNTELNQGFVLAISENLKRYSRSIKNYIPKYKAAWKRRECGKLILDRVNSLPSRINS